MTLAAPWMDSALAVELGWRERAALMSRADWVHVIVLALVNEGRQRISGLRGFVDRVPDLLPIEFRAL
jgi:hypothetical protein